MVSVARKGKSECGHESSAHTREAACCGLVSCPWRHAGTPGLHRRPTNGVFSSAPQPLARLLLLLPQHGSICVKGRMLDDHIEISVEDTGLGVAQDQIEAIFQPYEQVGRTRAMPCMHARTHSHLSSHAHIRTHGARCTPQMRHRRCLYAACHQACPQCACLPTCHAQSLPLTCVHAGSIRRGGGVNRHGPGALPGQAGPGLIW